MAFSLKFLEGISLSLILVQEVEVEHVCCCQFLFTASWSINPFKTAQAEGSSSLEAGNIDDCGHLAGQGEDILTSML